MNVSDGPSPFAHAIQHDVIDNHKEGSNAEDEN